MLNEIDEHQEIRDAVRGLCKRFPDEYFRKIDEQKGDPETFVDALMETGWLAANARVNDMHEVWAHPQLKARDRWTSVRTPNGSIPALLPQGRTDAYAPRMDAVPGLGQHSEAILAELGWSPDTIDVMSHDGAI